MGTLHCALSDGQQQGRNPPNIGVKFGYSGVVFHYIRSAEKKGLKQECFLKKYSPLSDLSIKKYQSI